MGDEIPTEVPIEIQVEVSDEPAPVGTGPGAAPLGGVGGSARLVREPSRWWRPAVVALVVALLAGGALTWDRIGSDAGDGADDLSAREEATRDYARAVTQLGHAGGFAYRGEVRSSGPGVLRPGRPGATDATVQGAVLLPLSLSRDVAVDSSGRAVETATAGLSVWARAADSLTGLDEVAWERVGDVPSWRVVAAGAAPPRLGTAALMTVLTSAADRRPAPPDATGRRVIRATVPDQGPSERLLPGAEVTLTLNEDGSPARIGLRSAPDDRPSVVMTLDIVRLGDGLLSATDVSAVPRAALPLEDVAAAGVAPVELGELPADWAMTDATLWLLDGAGPRPRTCPGVVIEYRNLRTGPNGYLSLNVMSEACRRATGSATTMGTAAGDEPPVEVRAGGFSGTVDDIGGDNSYGSVTDGETTVVVSSDQPAERVADLLATLAPFDPGRPIGRVSGEPSS